MEAEMRAWLRAKMLKLVAKAEVVEKCRGRTMCCSCATGETEYEGKKETDVK